MALTMSPTRERRDAPRVAEAEARNPAYQAFLLLRTGFTVAPVLFGLDKFFGVLVDWQE